MEDMLSKLKSLLLPILTLLAIAGFIWWGNIPPDRSQTVEGRFYSLEKPYPAYPDGFVVVEPEEGENQTLYLPPEVEALTKGKNICRFTFEMLAGTPMGTHDTVTEVTDCR